MEADLKTIADNISYLRNAKRLTIDQLAKKVGITRQTLSKYEKGLQYPTIKFVIRFSRLFGVDSNYLTMVNEGADKIVIIHVSKIKPKKA